jgi:hypothetical protein
MCGAVYGTEAKHLVRQREAMSLKRSEGNPSSTTIFTNDKHLQRGAFFVWRTKSPGGSKAPQGAAIRVVRQRSFYF